LTDDKWKEIGAELRSQLRREREWQERLGPSTTPVLVTGTAWEHVARFKTEHVSEFFQCVVAHLDGDPAPLRAYREAGKPLPASAGGVLMDVATAAAPAPMPRHMGRPQSVVQIAAAGADIYFKLWQELNRQKGVSSHGKRSQMLDEAADAVCANYFPALTDDDRAKVRELLDRPASRRTVLGI